MTVFCVVKSAQNSSSLLFDVKTAWEAWQNELHSDYILASNYGIYETQRRPHVNLLQRIQLVPMRAQ
jgi:hypothetical protein